MSRRERQRERVPHPASQSFPDQDREIGRLGRPHSGPLPAQLAPGERVDAPKLTATRLPGFDAELAGLEHIRPATAHEVVQRGMAERETGAQMVHVPVPRIVIQRRKWKAEEIRTLLQNNPRQESESALTWVNRLKELFGPGQMYTQKDWGDNVKDIKAAAAKSIESEQGQTQVQGGAWRSEAGDLVSEDTYNDSATDLNTLLNALSRDLHTVGPRTLIGGYAVKAKNAPKVETVNASARIDAQAPISGAYNIQFQIGDDSLANVVFTDADKEPQIKRYLRRSLREGQKYLSPSFTG